MKFWSMIKNKLVYVFAFSGILLLTWYVSANWYQLMLVHGDSMWPAYHDMQFVLSDRNTENYTYGDVIVFQCEGLDSVLMKRIAACPGDIVKIEDGRLYVNEEESRVFSKKYQFDYSGIADSPIQLTDNQYFVIGDNIEKSKDSRYREIGCVGRDYIIGKIIE